LQVLQETLRVSMLRILLFLSGCCLKTEVFKQLYFNNRPRGRGIKPLRHEWCSWNSLTIELVPKPGWFGDVSTYCVLSRIGLSLIVPARIFVVLEHFQNPVSFGKCSRKSGLKSAFSHKSKIAFPKIQFWESLSIMGVFLWQVKEVPLKNVTGRARSAGLETRR
jgi:hypothetical protein